VKNIYGTALARYTTIKSHIQDKEAVVSAERSLYGNDKGIALILVLMFVGAVALLGTVAVLMTSTDTKISGNYKASKKALYAAEAGAQEARERLRLSAEYVITDAHTDKTQWSAFIGTDPKTQKRGYDSSNSMHNKVASLQTDMDYTVVIAHQDDGAGNVLYLGDEDGDGDFERHIDATKNDPNIYVITSYGSADGASKVVVMEVTRVPPITIKSALYSGTSATIQGSVSVAGADSCGGSDLPGITTPQSDSPSPITVGGSPASVTGDEAYGTPNVKYDEDMMAIQSMADFLKKAADFKYEVSNATHTHNTTPGPGDGWGTPELASTPPSCDENYIVHYDTGGTSISLSGNVSGCGILLVEGDLDLSGGFEWYGTVIVTGSFQFTGGAGSKNIMGAVISGASTDGDFVGGNVDINYCSTATEDQTQKHSLPILSWKEDLGE
jgi:Tfp pilus assembly protein PilX